MADYFSNFLLIRVLNNPMATYEITILKLMFSEHGIPAHVFTDLGRQFTSEEFCEFAKCYGFEILHSTLRYPQSNGFIEIDGEGHEAGNEQAGQAREEAHLTMLAYLVTLRGPGKLSPPEARTQC